MSSKRDVGADDDLMQQYPSPTDGQENGPYYNTNVRDGQQHDSPTQQQQPAHPASVEELQLAAQLGQDLAGEPMMHATDPNMSVEDPSLRSIMPHPDQPVSRPYVPDEPIAEQLPPHVPVPMDHHLAHQYGIGDNTPPRKRSKVSRACDECRRKKVKCDAQSDSGDLPCSNCKRSGLRCLFSRVPQKRGPSKGYIKELADRINSIEDKLEIQVPVDEVSRKRPFSSISSADISTPAPARPAPWGSEPRPLQPMTTPSDRYQLTYSANSLAPQPIALKPDATPSRPPVASMDSVIGDMPGIDQPREVDDGVFHGYLNAIHPYLPLLPSSKGRVQEYLAQCPSLLREAFVEALSGTIHSFSSLQCAVTGDIRLANTMIAEWEGSEGSQHSPVTDVVYLQTLALMVIESDNRQSSTAGPPKESLLGRAVAKAYASKLYQLRQENQFEVEDDGDSDAQLRARIWWSLVLLDRWNAVGTGSPAMIRDESVVVPSTLKTLVGETSYLLIRSSKILGRASVIISGFQEPLTTSFSDRVVGSFFDSWIEDFREDLPPHVDPASYPLLHLVYWHCRLLAYLLNPSAKSTDILWPVKETIGLLTNNPQLASPLNQHFIVLTALCLMELAKVENTREEANRLLAEVLDSPTAPSAWDGLIRDRISDQLRPSTDSGPAPSSAEAAASQGLQHLADLATAHEQPSSKPDELGSFRSAPNYEDMGFDPRLMLLVGYLNLVRVTQG